MPLLSVTTTVRARGTLAPQRAWERYDRLDLWSRWSPQITGVEAESARLRPGLRGRVRGPLGVAIPFRVTSVDEVARTWEWEVAVGPLQLTMRHGVTARAGGSATWLTVTGPGPVVLAYLLPARVALHRLVNLPFREN